MIETKTGTTSNSTVICQSKKHWIVYVFPYFMIVLGLFFMLTTLKYYVIAGIAFIVISVMKILKYKSTQWTLTDTDLIIKSGFLPWRKTYLNIPVDTIFEAYYKHDLLSNIFGYGHLYIRRTEGMTSGFDESAMIKHGEITGKINTMIRELKKPQTQQITPQTQKSSNIDELVKLTELHRQGAITDEEFERLKQRLIN